MVDLAVSRSAGGALRGRSPARGRGRSPARRRSPERGRRSSYPRRQVPSYDEFYGAGFGKKHFKRLEREAHRHINRIYSHAKKQVGESYKHISKNGKKGIGQAKKNATKSINKVLNVAFNKLKLKKTRNKNPRKKLADGAAALNFARFYVPPEDPVYQSIGRSAYRPRERTETFLDSRLFQL
mgnify:CR=1 FL=1